MQLSPKIVSTKIKHSEKYLIVLGSLQNIDSALRGLLHVKEKRGCLCNWDYYDECFDDTMKRYRISYTLVETVLANERTELSNFVRAHFSGKYEYWDFLNKLVDKDKELLDWIDTL